MTLLALVAAYSSASRRACSCFCMSFWAIDTACESEATSCKTSGQSLQRHLDARQQTCMRDVGKAGRQRLACALLAQTAMPSLRAAGTALRAAGADICKSLCSGKTYSCSPEMSEEQYSALALEVASTRMEQLQHTVIILIPSRSFGALPPMPVCAFSPRWGARPPVFTQASMIRVPLSQHTRYICLQTEGRGGPILPATESQI